MNHQQKSETAIYSNFVKVNNCQTNKATTTNDVFHKYTIVQDFGTGSMGAVYKVKLKAGSANYPTGDKKRSGLFTLLRNTFSTKSLEPPVKQQQQQLPEDQRQRDREVDAANNGKNHNKTNDEDDDDDDYYALKCIAFDRISNEFIEELQNEIRILKNMDHPNIVKAYEVFYEFHKKSHIRMLYVVMELCTGGDLYSRTPYSEKDAAKIVTQLLSAVCYMHDHGIVHRDLKYENILFEDHSSMANIKVIDFGLSKKFKTGVPGIMTERVGTIYTMSPQVLKGVYTSQSDLWAVGVVAYMLLSSTKPFNSRNRRTMAELIMKADVSFDSPAWFFHISANAKEFVQKLLLKDPDERLNARDALNHPWITGREQLPDELPSQQVLDAIDDSLINYQYTSQLKKLALVVIAHRSSSKEILELRKVFDTFDTKKDGTLSAKEFRAALLSINFPEHEISSVFAAMDLNRNDKINYTEFLAATIETFGNIEEDRISEAFDRIDSDDDGYISKKNLQEALGKDYTKEKVEEIMRVSDTNHDGKISYAEFLAAFRNQISREYVLTLDPTEVS